MPTERNDFFKLGDNFATIIGDDVKVGDMAPEFTSVVTGWGTVNPLQESKGKVIILCAVPSIDTDTCDIETRRFNQEAANLSDDIVIYTVSMDFPFAQKRWCGAAGVDKSQTGIGCDLCGIRREVWRAHQRTTLFPPFSFHCWS